MQELRNLNDVLYAEKRDKENHLREREDRLELLELARMQVAQEALRLLIPDLKIHTIRHLRKSVPGFTIKTTAGWFGREKVAPSEDIDLVRVRLGIFLDNTDGTKPPQWTKTAGEFDRRLAACAADIKQIQRDLDEIAKRQAAIEKLLGGDLAKLPAETQKQIKHAAKVAHAKPAAMSEPIPSSRPQQYDTTSHSLDYVSMWLWYTILTDSADSSAAQTNLDPEHRTYDSDHSHQHNHDQLVPDASHHVHGDTATLDHTSPGHGTLAHHTDLGSQSFS